MITRLKFRHGTTAEWQAFNPTLSDGEPGYDSTLKRMKIGDGVQPWSSLNYVTVDSDALTALVAQVDAAVVDAQAAAASAQGTTGREVAGGVAGLDSGGKLYEVRLPDRLSESNIANIYNRANHVGTQPSSSIDGITAFGQQLLTVASAAALRGTLAINLVDNTPDNQKPLSGPQGSAVAALLDASETQTLNRQNHVGTQAVDTINGIEPWFVSMLQKYKVAFTVPTGVEVPPDPDPVTPPPVTITGAALNVDAVPQTNGSITVFWNEPTSVPSGKTIAGYLPFRDQPDWEPSTPIAYPGAAGFNLTNFSNTTTYKIGVTTVFTDGTRAPMTFETGVSIASSTGGGTTGGGGGTVPVGTVKIMPTGDSLTAVDASALGYKGIMLDSLVAGGFSIDYVGPYTSTGPAGLKDPNHYGLSGAQTSTLLGQYLATSTIQQQVATYTPDVVTLLIGVNDLWSNVALATSMTRYRQVMDMIFAAKSDAKVVVCRIPIMGVTQESGRAAFNAGVSQIQADYVAAGKKVYLADLSGTLAASDLQADGIHWTATGHTKIAAALFPTVRAAIVDSNTGGTVDPGTGGGTGGTTSSAPMPYPTHGIGMYHMMWTNSNSPSLATTPANVNNLRLAFFQGSPPTVTGPASEGSMANLGARLKELRAKGVRIIASVGGAQGAVNLTDRAGFVSGIMAFSNNVCPLDGLDFDLEGPAFGAADAVAIVQELKRQRGANFAVTMAPNGTVIATYLSVAVALKAAGITTDGFGHQFYDAVVDNATMKNRMDEYVGKGLPISKYEIGMMGCCGTFTADHYWDTATQVARLNYAKSIYPALGGAYLWQRGTQWADPFSSQVGGIIKTW